MRITDIELSGYKSIQNINLALKGINVLIGANGSGKSNFISFFQMLAFYLNNIDGFTEFVNKQGGANALLHYGAKLTKDIKAKISFETDASINTYSVELGYAINDRLYFKAESVCFSQHGKDLSSATEIPLGSGGNSSKLSTISIDDQDYTTYYRTINTFRNMMRNWRIYQFHDTSTGSFIRNTHRADDNTYFRGDGGNLAAFLFMLKNDYPERFAAIQQYLCFVAPYIEEIIPREEYNSSQYITLQWKERNFDYSLGIGQMSDGTLRALALITLLEQPKLPEVICIDEPELGLHPEAIRLLGSLIVKASERAQVIISTQSTILLDCFNPEDVIICDRNMGHTSLKRLDTEQYKIWLDDYALSAVWDTNIIGGRP